MGVSRVGGALIKSMGLIGWVFGNSLGDVEWSFL